MSVLFEMVNMITREEYGFIRRTAAAYLLFGQCRRHEGPRIDPDNLPSVAVADDNPGSPAWMGTPFAEQEGALPSVARAPDHVVTTGKGVAPYLLCPARVRPRKGFRRAEEVRQVVEVDAHPCDPPVAGVAAHQGHLPAPVAGPVVGVVDGAFYLIGSDAVGPDGCSPPRVPR